MHAEKWAKCYRHFHQGDTDTNMYLKRYFSYYVYKPWLQILYDFWVYIFIALEILHAVAFIISWRLSTLMEGWIAELTTCCTTCLSTRRVSFLIIKGHVSFNQLWPPRCGKKEVSRHERGLQIPVNDVQVNILLKYCNIVRIILLYRLWKTSYGMWTVSQDVIHKVTLALVLAKCSACSPTQEIGVCTARLPSASFSVHICR